MIKKVAEKKRPPRKKKLTAKEIDKKWPALSEPCQYIFSESGGELILNEQWMMTEKFSRKKTRVTGDIKENRKHIAGIDIGADRIHVAILDENSDFHIREFGAMTPDLNGIAAWLLASNVKVAAMEATGVYWIPLFEILEDKGIKAVLVDPKSLKKVPGRKTDFIDAQWIHQTYSCDLLTPAFRPEKAREGFRSYMRHRSNLIKARQVAILQMDKSLLLMNLKLDLVVSEIISVTGMRIIRAIVGGERNACKLASLRHQACKQPERKFIAALTGNFQETHLFALKQSLETFDYFAKQMDECDKMIKAELESWPTVEMEVPASKEKGATRNAKKFVGAKKPDQNEFNFDLQALLHQKVGVDLTAINSIGLLTAATIISEIGGKKGLDKFANEKSFCSWLTLCPGNNVSGGKSLGGQSRKGKNRIKRALCMACISLCNSKCSLGAFYRRLAARIGKGKAIKATAHKLARLIYRLIKNGEAYVQVGQETQEKKQQEKKHRKLIKSAKELGFDLVRAA